MHAVKSPTILTWEELDKGDKYWLTSQNGQYYVYRVAPKDWRAGRVAFGHAFDFKSLTFSSAHVAMKYCQRYESEKVIYVRDPA